jgi:hypothetical protein
MTHYFTCGTCGEAYDDRASDGGGHQNCLSREDLVDEVGRLQGLEAEATERGAELFHALSALIETLPKCGVVICSAPATREYNQDGVVRGGGFCDEHRANYPQGVGIYAKEAPELPHAEALRAAVALLKKIHTERALETGEFT